MRNQKKNKTTLINKPDYNINSFTHEYKYPISLYEKLKINRKLNALSKGENCTISKGTYKIRNLYFSDIIKNIDTDIDNNSYQEKFRMRIYDDDFDTIRVEKKSRINFSTKKEVAFISRNECRMLLKRENTFLLEKHSPILTELYTKLENNLIKPDVIIEYNREVNVLTPENTRISFDNNISVSYEIFSFLNKYLQFKQIDSGVLLEIKCKTNIPANIEELIPFENLNNSSICMKNQNYIISKI